MFSSQTFLIDFPLCLTFRHKKHKKDSKHKKKHKKKHGSDSEEEESDKEEKKEEKEKKKKHKKKKKKEDKEKDKESKKNFRKKIDTGKSELPSPPSRGSLKIEFKLALNLNLTRGFSLWLNT